MKPAGWWSVVVAAVTTALAVYLAVDGSLTPRAWGAWVALAAFAAVFFGYGLTAVRNTREPHDVILTLINAGLVALGAAFDPMLAMLQTVMYPLVWYTARSVRVAWMLNPLIALGTFVGLLLFTGPVNPWLALSTSVVSLAFSLAMGAWITSMMRHGDERSRLLDELQAAQDELALRNQEAGASSERERIARDLHDTIAQNLTAIVMHTQRLARGRASGRTVAADDLALIESLASESLTETRTLVAAMTPVAIETGLVDALRRLAERFDRETGVTVRVTAVNVDREREMIVLRCAQEALANVRKHAHARSVDLSVEEDGGLVTLRVQDDGIGLPEAYRDGAELGFGLSGMRSRLAQVGGSLELTSGGAGTLLEATIPEAS